MRKQAGKRGVKLETPGFLRARVEAPKTLEAALTKTLKTQKSWAKIELGAMAFPIAGGVLLHRTVPGTRPAAPACSLRPVLRSAFLGERSGCLQPRSFCGCQLQRMPSQPGRGTRKVTAMAAKGERRFLSK